MTELPPSPATEVQATDTARPAAAASRRRSSAAAAGRRAGGGQTLDALSTSFARALARARHPEVLAAHGIAPAGLAVHSSRRRTYFLLGTLGRLRDRTTWTPARVSGGATPPGARP